MTKDIADTVRELSKIPHDVQAQHRNTLMQIYGTVRNKHMSWGDWALSDNIISLTTYDRIHDTTIIRFVGLDGRFNIEIKSHALHKMGAFYQAVISAIKQVTNHEQEY